MAEPESHSRWQLIRDLVVFQLKLAVDAVRDVVLSPISLIAGVLDIVSRSERPHPRFYDVLLLGRRTERWINLFGEADRVEPAQDLTRGQSGSLDAIVGQVEQLIVDQYEKGGVTAQAKDTIDRSLDTLTRERKRPQKTEPDE